MRKTVLLPALGVALLAGTSLARAQTVDTFVAPVPAPMVVADPVVVAEPSAVIETVPVQTTRTVQTERLTTHPVRRIARAPVLRSRQPETVTTTRTTVREDIGPAPVGRPVAAVVPPTYTEVMDATPPLLTISSMSFVCAMAPLTPIADKAAQTSSPHVVFRMRSPLIFASVDGRKPAQPSTAARARVVWVSVNAEAPAP